MGDGYPPWQPRPVPLKNQREAASEAELEMQHDEIGELE